MQDSFDRSSAFKALNSGVAVLNPAQTVWTAMLDGWDRQQLSRGLTRSTILSRRRIVQRFQSFTASYPWEWRSGDLDDFSVELNSPTRRAYSTLRQYHGAIETFCSYLVDPSYDWAELCERQFGQSPSQICSPFNTVRHANDYEGHPARRPFTYDELQRLFDCADARVDLITGGVRRGVSQHSATRSYSRRCTPLGSGELKSLASTWLTFITARACRNGSAMDRCKCAGGNHRVAVRRGDGPYSSCLSSTGG